MKRRDFLKTAVAGISATAAVPTLSAAKRSDQPNVVFLFADQMRALQRRPDQQGTLRRVQVPTLVMGGAHDRMCPPRRHEFMAQLIPGARLEILEDAGHLLTQEAPGASLEALRAWLSA